MRGFVYVLTNSAMPGLVKIGKTERTPDERAEELQSTGVPFAFELQWFGQFEDMAAVELKLHKCFHKQRVSKWREFFKIDVEIVVTCALALNPVLIGGREEINGLAERRRAEELQRLKERQAKLENERLKKINRLFYLVIYPDDAPGPSYGGMPAHIGGHHATLESAISLANKLINQKFSRGEFHKMMLQNRWPEAWKEEFYQAKEPLSNAIF